MTNQTGRHYRGRPRGPQNGLAGRIADGLGWFSVALGLAEVLAPGAVAKVSGLKDSGGRRALLRVYGLREMAAGIGILSGKKPAGWLWGRVAGDVVDLASLGAAAGGSDTKPGKLATATAAVVGVTALDVYCAQKLSGVPEKGGTIRVSKSVIIDRSPEEVYAYWRDFENLSRFMTHLESVEVTGENRSHWRAKGPAGIKVEWESEITRDEPSSMIQWRSVSGDIRHGGCVQFERATGGRGTVVRVQMQYSPPGGAIGSGIAKLFGADPKQHVEQGLRQLKQILETGSIVKSDASIHDRMHPARPPAEWERPAMEGTWYQYIPPRAGEEWGEEEAR